MSGDPRRRRSAAHACALLLAYACAACGVTMHVAFDDARVPADVRARATQRWARMDVGGTPVLEGYTALDPRARRDEQTEAKIARRAAEIHVRAVYLDAGGRPLYAGEVTGPIADGGTIVVPLDTTVSP